MLPASFAACVPVFMATPTSACASAGASLVPSPVIATSRPPACSRLISAILSSGLASARKSSTPASCGDRRGGERIVAGDHHGADAHGAQPVEALAHAALHDVLEIDDAQHARRRAVALGHHQRRAALAGDPLHQRGAVRPARRRHARAPSATPRRPRPCGSGGRPRVDAAHPGRRRERHEFHAAVPCGIAQLAAAQAEPLLGQHHDAPALGRLVRQRGELRPVGQLPAPSTPVTGMKRGRLAIAQRDRPGLVEQQRVHVARRLDRAPAHRDHVLLDQPVHARDADGREQAADGRRDQADQQRHQHRNRHRRCRRRWRTAAASPPPAGRRWSAPTAGWSARSRWGSSGARRPPPARSSGRGTSRRGWP